MRFVDFEGTLNLSLLARFAAEPLIGDDRGDYVMLDRPVTRFLVLTDAENKFVTRCDRAKQWRLLLDSIMKGLPADLRRDLYTREARIVEILDRKVLAPAVGAGVGEPHHALVGRIGRRLAVAVAAVVGPSLSPRTLALLLGGAAVARERCRLALALPPGVVELGLEGCLLGLEPLDVLRELIDLSLEAPTAPALLAPLRSGPRGHSTSRANPRAKREHFAIASSLATRIFEKKFARASIQQATKPCSGC